MTASQLMFTIRTMFAATAVPIVIVSLACILHAYIGYPLLISLVAKIRRPHNVSRIDAPKSLTIVLAAYNEAATIERRLTELTTMVSNSGLIGEVVVVSDGSTDATVRIARSFPSDFVRVIEMPGNAGKAVALSLGCASATGDILVFADARQSWDSDAIKWLIRAFENPQVGAVGGELVIQSDAGVMAGVGAYWRYEKWLRRMESRVHSTVGVSGSICAVRRRLFTAIPAGTILDDVYWPMRVVMQGYRVLHEDRAIAYDRLPAKTTDEFRRKIRTLSGNFQLLTRLPALLVPWRNPIYFQFVCHKVLRLIVPWALIATFCTTAIMPGLFFQLLFISQLLFYALAIVGLIAGQKSRLSIASVAGSFVVLNLAAWLAFWVWITGQAGKSWRKSNYSTDLI